MPPELKERIETYFKAGRDRLPKGAASFSLRLGIKKWKYMGPTHSSAHPYNNWVRLRLFDMMWSQKKQTNYDKSGCCKFCECNMLPKRKHEIGNLLTNAK